MKNTIYIIILTLTNTIMLSQSEIINPTSDYSDFKYDTKKQINLNPKDFPEKAMKDFNYYLAYSFDNNSNTQLFVYKLFNANSFGDVLETFQLLENDKKIQNEILQRFAKLNGFLPENIKMNLLSIGIPTKSTELLTDYMLNLKNGIEEKQKLKDEFKENIITVEMPEFKGGKSELKKYLQENLIYPEIAKEAGITGTCNLSFQVEADGSITNIKIIKGVRGCSECDKEAIRIVKKMPKWKAGKQGDTPVVMNTTLAISFVLTKQ